MRVERVCSAGHAPLQVELLESKGLALTDNDHHAIINVAGED